jgi:hypothetical protein
MISLQVVLVMAAYRRQRGISELIVSYQLRYAKLTHQLKFNPIKGMWRDPQSYESQTHRH